MFFFSWRKVVVAAAVIVAALPYAGVVLFLLGVAVNLTIVAGLVLGLVVVIDDAITDTENIAGRLPAQHSPRQVPARRIIIDSLVEMRRPAFWASLMVGAVAVPIFFTRGVSGAFLPPVFIAFLLAALTSFVVTLTVTPGPGQAGPGC